MLNYVIQVNFEKPKFLKVGKVRKMLKSLSKKGEKYAPCIQSIDFQSRI